MDAPTIIRKDYNEDQPRPHHAPDKQPGQAYRFVNPWPSFQERTRWEALTTIPFMKFPPLPPNVEGPEQVQVDMEQVNSPPSDQLQVTWLGHAAFLVQMGGVTVLTDPALSNRCSPVQFVGPDRYSKPAATPATLPDVIDAVVISHNHYDHLDASTVQDLKGRVKTWFVPLGNQPWFEDAALGGEIVELDWWQSGIFEKEGVEFICTPAQHFANRSLIDRNATLWASWAIVSHTTSQRVWFGGDTGYRSIPKGMTQEEEEQGTKDKTIDTCPAFAEIGERFGPFDCSLIPIGAYEPRFFMSPIHLNPFDSVYVHQDVRSKHSIGCHWGCWALTEEPVLEPPEKLRVAASNAGLKEDEFVIMPIGSTKVIPK